MTTKLFKRLAILAFCLAGIPPAWAAPAPVLKAQVGVAGPLVTIGDMFTNPGKLSGTALFRSPAPGTSGFVDIAAVRTAVAAVGFSDFNDQNVQRVRVSRLATPVDAKMLTGLIDADLKARGILSTGMTAQMQFDQVLVNLNAAATPDPVQLVNLRYMPQSGSFAARFILAGQDTPLDATGRIDLMIAAPQLVASLPAGTILQASDIEMRPIPLKFAETTGPATLDQLVGKQLRRQSRAGMTLRAVDVTEPELISRNEPVTVYLRSGPMTLTIKGTALNSASKGEQVGVLNLMSKKVLHGIARADGAVEIPLGTVTVAGL